MNTNTPTHALKQVLAVVQRYLPPDGLSAHDALTEVIGIVDPWPLADDFPHIDAIKDVWVAWTNTDLTEGRGYTVPLAVCASEATALRLGQKGYVMGSGCPISKVKAINVPGSGWLVPGVIHGETEADRKRNAEIEARRAVVAKAKAAGLSDSDIEALGAPA